MNYSIIVNQVFTLFIVMIVGVIARKKGYINEQVNRKLSDILLHVTSPMLIFSSFLFEFSKEKLVTAGYVSIFAVLMFFLSILSAEFVFKKVSDDAKGVMKASLVFSNCGYMGIPVIGAVAGKEGVFYASIFVIVFLIFLYTYGIVLFDGGSVFKSLKKALVSPALLAVYIGFPVFLFQIKVPEFIVNAADMTGAMTMPLAMIIVGAIFAGSDIKKMLKDKRVYYGSFIRLVLIPLITLGIGKAAGLPENAVKYCVILFGMPVAANVVVFAEKFESNSFLASKLVTISTLFSIITIPLVLLLIGWI